MRENNILDDSDEPFAVIRVFIPDTVKLGRLGNVSLTTKSIIGIAINNILIDILTLEMRNSIVCVTPFKPAAGRKPLLEPAAELLTAHALGEGY